MQPEIKIKFKNSSFFWSWEQTNCRASLKTQASRGEVDQNLQNHPHWISEKVALRMCWGSSKNDLSMLEGCFANG